MPKQILLADDSITIQKVIALTFAGEDYKITAVDNGADAIIKAREINPDIVLADVMMPQKNGYEVCEALKGDPGLRGIPVLLLAGTFEPFDEDLAKKAGADGFIIKPFESQALIQKVRELISARPAMPVAVEVTPSAPVVPAPPKPVAPAAIPVQPPVQPVVSPAAPVPPKPPVSPAVTPTPPEAAVPPAPAVIAPAPPAEEDFWGTIMEEVEEEEAPKEELPAEAPEKVVSEEEVWDIGEFEEAEAAPAAEKVEEELWESFAFEEAGGEEMEEAMEAPEEEFLFGEEEMAEPKAEEAPQIEFEEAPVEPVEEPLEILPEEPELVEEEEFAFAEELPEVPEIPKVQMEPQPEIVQGYEQMFEPEAIGQEIPLAAPPEVVPTPPPSAISLSEEQLRAALSQVSREVIEKIVWEVVPDLAEMLIKEEIKRLQKKQ